MIGKLNLVEQVAAITGRPQEELESWSKWDLAWELKIARMKGAH